MIIGMVAVASLAARVEAGPEVTIHRRWHGPVRRRVLSGDGSFPLNTGTRSDVFPFQIPSSRNPCRNASTANAIAAWEAPARYPIEDFLRLLRFGYVRHNKQYCYKTGLIRI